MFDGLVWISGCKDEEWLVDPKVRANQSRKEPTLFVNEAEWATFNLWVFIPVGPIKMVFDLIVMLCVIYSCAVVPYRVAFDDAPTGDIELGFELGVQTIFILDVVLNFNTAFLNSERWIIHRPSIARNYLRGWFWIDAPASLPLLEIYSMVISRVELTQDDRPTREQMMLLRAFRLFRLLRLLKMLKFGEAVRTLEYATGLDLKALQVLSTVVLLAAFTHLMACLFYAISLASSSSFDGVSWVSYYTEFDETTPPNERYVVSLLWAVGVVTGLNSDVEPANFAERVTAIIVYVLSALLFALVVAVVTQQRLAYANDAFNLKMGEVSNFCRFHRVPRGLQDKLQQFFEAMYTNTSVVTDEELIFKMTPSLQEQVWTHILASTVKKIALFDNLKVNTGGKAAAFFGETRGFHIGVYQALAYVTYSPKESIIPKGTIADTLFFVRRGEVHAATPGASKRYLYSISDLGAFFGERCLLEPPEAENVDFDARARCDIFCLAKSDLLQLVAHHLVPAHRQKLATDVFAEITRKADVHVSALKAIAADATDEDAVDDFADEIEPLEAGLKELKETNAREAMPSLGGGEVDDDNLDASNSGHGSATSLKVQGARMGMKSSAGVAAGAEGSWGASNRSAKSVETKITELGDSVKAMEAMLQKVLVKLDIK